MAETLSNLDWGTGQEIFFLGDAVHALLRCMPATARRANRRHNAGGEPSFARLCESPKKNISCPVPREPGIGRSY